MSNAGLIEALGAIIGSAHVLSDRADLIGYDCDGRGPWAARELWCALGP